MYVYVFASELLTQNKFQIGTRIPKDLTKESSTCVKDSVL